VGVRVRHQCVLQRAAHAHTAADANHGLLGCCDTELYRSNVALIASQLHESASRVLAKIASSTSNRARGASSSMCEQDQALSAPTGWP